MLIARFRETFRDRQMEWALAAGALAWGQLLVNAPQNFERPFFQPLARMGTAAQWGWGMSAIGLVGLVALFVNGSRPRGTPALRVVSSIGRMFAWAGLVFGCLSVEWQTPAVATYTMVLLMEVMAMSNATADGHRAAARVAANGR